MSGLLVENCHCPFRDYVTDIAYKQLSAIDLHVFSIYFYMMRTWSSTNTSCISIQHL